MVSPAEGDKAYPHDLFTGFKRKFWMIIRKVFGKVLKILPGYLSDPFSPEIGALNWT
jgi:hypothetical protein